MEDVKFLVEQIEFMLEGEVEAHEVLADYINEPYNEIVKEKVWPPSGDHYIKHMYYNAYAHENAAYTSSDGALSIRICSGSKTCNQRSSPQ